MLRISAGSKSVRHRTIDNINLRHRNIGFFSQLFYYSVQLRRTVAVNLLCIIVCQNHLIAVPISKEVHCHAYKKHYGHAAQTTEEVAPSSGRPVNRTLHLMPYLQKRRAPVLAPWMDLAISLVSLTNRWGADILPEEFAQALRDWRKPDGCDCRNLGFAAAAAGSWGFPAWLCWGGLNILRDEMRKGYGAVVALQATPAEKEHGLPDRRFAAVRGFVAGASAPQVLLCDPWADGTDFDAETAMPLDDFLVAWDNVALLMRRRLEEQPAWAPTHGSAWIRPVGTDAPGIYRLYVNGEEHPIPDDFCALGGLLAWTTPDDHPHATTAHRSFHFVEPEAGGIRLESGETPCKYTVYLIDTSGCMLVGDVTV